MIGVTPSILKRLPMTPTRTPPPPPMSESSTASSRNWARIAALGAPTALRIPISRVRSVTRDEHDVHDADPADEQRDRRDRAEQRREHLGARGRGLEDRALVDHLKLLGRSAPAVTGSSWLRMSVTSVWLAVSASADFAWTRIWLMLP